MRPTTLLRIALAAAISSVGCRGGEAPSTADATQTATSSAPLAPSHPPTLGTSIPPLPSGDISGELVLPEQLKKNVAAGDVIFLIARNAATGQTIAVSKLVAPATFPLPFSLSGAHVMFPGASLAGKVRLLARVDKDGDAMTKNPGDVVGEMGDLVLVPAKNVQLALDTLL